MHTRVSNVRIRVTTRGILPPSCSSGVNDPRRGEKVKIKERWVVLGAKINTRVGMVETEEKGRGQNNILSRI